MDMGMVGLGRMGGAMAQRLRADDHRIIGHDRDPSAGDVADLGELVASLEAPRAIWVMVPAGGPTQDVIDDLAGRLEPGDLLVDGGNAFHGDSRRRATELGEVGIHFVDAGVSGGVWGLKEGYCLMVGGDAADIERLSPVFTSLAPDDGWAHVGPVGSGHFTKMVHNAVEYGMMQAYAEGYELLGASEYDLDVPATIEVWRHGSVVRSWLLDLMAGALATDAQLSHLRGYAEDSGEGRWAVQEAVRLAVPAPVTSAALYARFASRQQDSPAMRLIAALRNAFGGHAVTAAETGTTT